MTNKNYACQAFAVKWPEGGEVLDEEQKPLPTQRLAERSHMARGFTVWL